MSRSRLVPVWGLALCLFTGTGQPASGELTADQIAIIANRNSSDSLAVARHYASRRRVPTTQILALDLPADETIPRSMYEKKIVLAVRQMLAERRVLQKVRVLVTTYGMPLRVDAPLPTDAERRWHKDAQERQRFARAYLEKIPQWAAKIAPDEGSANRESAKPMVPTPSTPTPETDEALLQRVGQAVRDAAARLARSRDSEKPERVKRWNEEFLRITSQVGGSAALIQNVQASVPPEGTRGEMTKLRQQVSAAEAMIQVLNEAPSDGNRTRAYRLAERMFGLQGILHLANTEVDTFSFSEGAASLDSELALLWWDTNMYRITGRTPNPFFYDSPVHRSNQRPPLPVMLVSRLDAPTPDLAMRLVDQAMEAEERGLTGKVYADARGLTADRAGYGLYDEGIREMAALFRRHTSYPVILEDTERRFSEPGEAPEVAVYTGWYKLRSYEDAFTFVPGAMGYHIASAEAVSIHDPHETGWCKNALDRGITVTLGSTGEPYVDAFPLPSDFMALLLTGRYSLVEAYALTTRHVSWRMVLFGDPLYRPWRNRPGVKEGDVVLHRENGIQAGLPLAPSDLPLHDPTKTKAELDRVRSTKLEEIKRVMENMERRPNKGARHPRR